jgi:hypothetical protein
VNCGGVIERGMGGEMNSQVVQMLISPNPAGDKILVRFSEAVEQGTRMEIFDMTGRLQKTLDVAGDNTFIEVATAEFSNGIYLCRLTSEGKLIAAEKFSIQH